MSRLSEGFHEIAHSEKVTNLIVGNGSPARIENSRSGRQASFGQWNIGSDGDVARLDVFGDILVGCTESGSNNQFHHYSDRCPQYRIRDEHNSKPVAAGDLVDLVLHRTGIRIDVDNQHFSHPDGYTDYIAKPDISLEGND
jgi:hypothetical protein